MKRLLTLSCLLATQICMAQISPVITSWKINTNGSTGFGGIPTNVQQVQYSTNNVYISTTDIADWIPIGYDWPNNPWSPQNQNFVFKITRNPTKNNGPLVKTPYGHIGIWTNGVSIYNPKDAHSYLDSGKWFQNAFYFEHLNLETMDSCLGHPNDRFEYHLHVHPKCLWDENDGTKHAPLIGYAFDGFPIYGGYGYANTDGTGGIVRMRSSYKLRNITDRTVLPDGAPLQPVYYGPTLSQHPLGAYVEDYEYVAGYGNLDDHNGRFCVTPEYPNGIYAYFATIDANIAPEYPYVLGTTYYGTVQPGNTGPNSGYNTITEQVTVYTSVNTVENKVVFLLQPNPANDVVNFFILPSYHQNLKAEMYDMYGKRVYEAANIQTGVNYTINICSMPTGQYVLVITNGVERITKRLAIQH